MLSQSNGISFIYDNNGVVGLKYDNKTYFYRKDIQGNIIAILDSTGDVVVEYTYDAWGNHVVMPTDEAYTELSQLNPFRYRGYYYDTETGLYFLKTRYYDPEVGRFITIDDLSYLDPDTINGLNLYAYCGDNPVMRTDSNGSSWWSDFWKTAFAVVTGVALLAITVVGAAIAVLATGGAALVPIIGGFVVGAGANLLGQGFANLHAGKSFFDGINVGSILIAGLTGAAFGTGLGGLFTSVVIGALGNAGIAAANGESWTNIGINAFFGALAGGIGYGISKGSSLRYKCGDKDFGTLWQLGKIDGRAFSPRVLLHAFIGSSANLIPSILCGVSRALIKFVGGFCKEK